MIDSPYQENENNTYKDTSKLEDKIKEVVRVYLSSFGFVARKVTDTPTDSLQVVNRKFVTLNGSTSNRPNSSVVGQFYYDTTIGRPIYWTGTQWKDAAGSVS